MARWRSRSRDGLRPSIVALAIGVASAGVVGAESSGSAELRFSRHGETVATRSVEALTRLVPPQRVRVFEPYENREIPFVALSLDAVLDAIYTDAWRSEEEILFTCLDGYQPTLPVQRALDHRGWLAVARIDQADFSIQKVESGSRQRIRLAPVYLVWENLDDDALRREGDYGWPYQLVGIDLIRARERFPKMVPPEGAPADAVAGFTAFRVHCSRCHAINGEGGTIGPDLNVPANPVETRNVAWIRRWIDDPSQILPTARMPRLNPALPARDRVIEQLIRYLQAMAADPKPGASDEATPNGS